MIERARRDFLIEIYLSLKTNLELDVEAYDLMQFVRGCSQNKYSVVQFSATYFLYAWQKQLIHNLAVDKETKTN